MNILTQDTYDEKSIITSISSFCKEYSVGKVLKKANTYKSKGIPVIYIFMYLLQLVYTKKSMYMNILNGTHDAGFGKDVVYRFLNSPFINWATFMLSLTVRIIAKISGLTSDNRVNAIVVYDILYSRPRSKNVKLLANVHDHTGKGGRFKCGFRLLTLAWTDGVTLIPLLFRHLSLQNKKNRLTETNPKIDKRSCGYKARQQAISSSPKVFLEMLGQIVKAGVPFAEALELILSLLRDVWEENLFLSGKQIDELIDAFIAKLPEYYKSKMEHKKSILTGI
ncbi:hypothetical protein KVG29_11165 [Caldicoprobacter algeriensis]|uniref:hypothetical protein n=1 Tax=Caldicoprobacter algeriensis TaxID=699281 RepID=UPI002079DAA6|nr:hypothetical protein [Caldicoprobacter algeriensis]MCM8901776.1 hypothetical protein [Caldicoprobacter algeriensis]